MDKNIPDQTLVTEQRLLRAVAVQKELFEEKLGRVEGTLESRMMYLSQMIQWVAIMALALSVLIALGGIFMAVNTNGQAPSEGHVILERPLPGEALSQEAPSQEAPLR